VNAEFNDSTSPPELARRTFLQLVGTGLVVAVCDPLSLGAAAANASISRRFADATRLMAGKVECGQGSRAELAQAAAEELRIPVSRIQVMLADTAAVPDDGITAGSRTTPSTVPAVRRAAASLREALLDHAAKTWNVSRTEVQIVNGEAAHKTSGRTLPYSALNLAIDVPVDAPLTPPNEWKVLGTSVSRPNGRDIVTGQHRYPSDPAEPHSRNCWYGKVLRPPSFGAKLISVDLSPAQSMKDVVVVREDQFVGVAAASSFLAGQALDAIAQTARWEETPQPSSDEVYDYLRQHVGEALGANPFAEEVANAKQAVRATYTAAYVQHAPLEPRAALASWNENTLSVSLGTQNPFGCRGEMARALNMPEQSVLVRVPDFGSGFGGKHSAEVGIEAARLAKAAHRPVSLRWTRQEEFTWAYFRPAAVIDIEATLDSANQISSWYFVNINSGQAALETPYALAKQRSRFLRSNAPLRQGSYRALAATANTFARECVMDELALQAKVDPLAFRLAHLGNPRLRAVLEAAAARFGWPDRNKQKAVNTGFGIACGTEKGSYVASCVEVEVDRKSASIHVKRLTEVFECGAILNPENLLSQVEGAIIMSLGPTLREQMLFKDGKIENASFSRYRVPRFTDVPNLDIHLLNRPDLDSVGGGETPIIGPPPAVANAVFDACGVRLRSLPLRLLES
jgi:isoquinoline 1-oxidoreductase